MNTASDVPASDEEERRKLFKPKASAEQVSDILSECYCASKEEKIQVIRELESYDDNNFLVSINSVKYLFKISNGVETQNYIKNQNNSVIHLQNIIFCQLDKYGIKTSWPIPKTNRSNEKQNDNSNPFITLHSLPVVSPTHSPCTLVVRLFRWVAGVPMSSVTSLSIETLAEAGTYLGKTCLALDRLSPDDGTNVNIGNWFHAWDGKQTSDLRNFVHCIKDERRRKIVENVIAEFEEKVIPDSHQFRTGILQGDFNDANIIIDDGKVAGVIDFGDTVRSWRVLDVTIAMAYAMLTTYGKSNHSLAAAAAILRGFHSFYPLTQIERRHLRLLMTCRLACSVTLGAFSLQQNPENKYLLLHAEPGWKALEFLNQNDPNNIYAIENLLQKACANHKMKTGVMDCSDISFLDSEIITSFKDKSILLNSNLESKKRKRNSKHTITFVTGNKKKLEEVKRILSATSDGELPFIISNHKLDLPELQGEPNEIAKEKCAEAAKEINGPVITEDTSLCYNALNGLPGPYIKWFLDKCGHDGLNKLLAGYQDKSAYAQTTVGFCLGPDEKVHLFEGCTTGKIVGARGKLDFGWDPVFEPDEGGGKTYAEMTKDQKDAISHRSRAFKLLREYLVSKNSLLQSKMDKI